MDRREALAETTTALLSELRSAVIDSWGDLLPGSAEWTPEARARAIAAAQAALEGVASIIAQGDLDDHSWTQTREAVYGRGHAAYQEVEELLRTVRVVGLELLLDRLDEAHALSPDERWSLQQQTHGYCEALHRQRDEVDPETVEALLADLERDGPDLA